MALITDAARQSFRDMLGTATFKPKSAEYADAAEVLTRLLPVMVASIPDAEIDRRLLDLYHMITYGSLLLSPPPPKVL